MLENQNIDIHNEVLAAYRKKRSEDLASLKGQARTDYVNNQKGPWNDKGRMIQLDSGEVCEVTGNFTDGGVKYLSKVQNRAGNYQYWLPRFEVTFVQ